jgi:hypothetical protein
MVVQQSISTDCTIICLGNRNRECLVYRGDEEKLLYKRVRANVCRCLVLLGCIPSAAR